MIEDVVIKKLSRHTDERGYFEELIRNNDDFFKEGFGQLSHSVMYPGVIKAWHVHKTQVDWWYVSRGNLKVALYDTRKDSRSYKLINEFFMGDNYEKIILKIPPGVAHGCKVIGETSELFYITSKIYDPKEEGRIPFDDNDIGYDWLKHSPIK
jgi:dTDP-4-dehydrorhamnose 3,5-epimerase